MASNVFLIASVVFLAVALCSAAGSVLGVAPRALSVRAVPGRPCGVRAVPQRFLPYLFICCIYLFILAGECGSRPRPRLQQQRLLLLLLVLALGVRAAGHTFCSGLRPFRSGF